MFYGNSTSKVQSTLAYDAAKSVQCFNSLQSSLKNKKKVLKRMKNFNCFCFCTQELLMIVHDKGTSALHVVLQLMSSNADVYDYSGFVAFSLSFSLMHFFYKFLLRNSIHFSLHFCKAFDAKHFMLV